MKVVALNGSYRRGGTIDQVVNEILAAAHKEGAEIEQVFLIDQNVAFCKNCRQCMQTPGVARGACVHHDAMPTLLDTLEAADAIVLASPVNFGTVTAVMKRFLERLACYAYWPWGAPAPRFRITTARKPAVIVASSAMPGWMARIFTNTFSLLRKAAKVLGCRVVGSLAVGLAAGKSVPDLSAGIRRRAHALGLRLVGCLDDHRRAAA